MHVLDSDPSVWRLDAIYNEVIYATLDGVFEAYEKLEDICEKEKCPDQTDNNFEFMDGIREVFLNIKSEFSNLDKLQMMLLDLFAGKS